MQTFLFDDQGEIWDAKSHRLAEVLQASLRGEALVDYVIRNLGFVAVTQSNESLRIRVRPSVVSQTAFGALVYWLHDRPIERVLLSFFGTEWTHELVRSRDEVAQRLMARMPFKADDRTGDFLKETLPLHDLPLASPLRALLRAWSECGGKFDRERLTPCSTTRSTGALC